VDQRELGYSTVTLCIYYRSPYPFMRCSVSNVLNCPILDIGFRKYNIGNIVFRLKLNYIAQATSTFKQWFWSTNQSRSIWHCVCVYIVNNFDKIPVTYIIYFTRWWIEIPTSMHIVCIVFFSYWNIMFLIRTIEV